MKQRPNALRPSVIRLARRKQSGSERQRRSRRQPGTGVAPWFTYPNPSAAGQRQWSCPVSWSEGPRVLTAHRGTASCNVRKSWVRKSAAAGGVHVFQTRAIRWRRRAPRYACESASAVVCAQTAERRRRGCLGQAHGFVGPAGANLGQQRRAAELVADDRQLRLAVDDLIGHRVATRACEDGGHGVSVTR